MEMNANSLRISIAERQPPEGSLGVIDLLLRDRDTFHQHLERSTDLASVARALLLTVIAGCAVFGAAMGANRGGLQLAFAAVKLPLVVLLTAGFCGPALTGLLRAVKAESIFDGEQNVRLLAHRRPSMAAACRGPR
jgi:hypothetical protein